MLLTTKEIAAVLKVHPKHVYRLLKRGLPAHRVGDEWRFDADEVRRYCRERGDSAGAPAAPEPRSRSGAAPPLLAANGDVVIEVLLDEMRARHAPCVGHVQADHGSGLELFTESAVLVAGCHGEHLAADVAALGVARIHIVEREVGLAFHRGLRLRSASGIVGRRLASRPATAGIRAHLDEALRRAGVEPEQAGAELHSSHRDVVMAVLRGDADVGLASRAWAARAGLAFLSLASEAYGLMVRAEDLGDPRVVALCETAQSAGFRKKLRGDLGYEPRRAGEIRVSARR